MYYHPQLEAWREFRGGGEEGGRCVGGRCVVVSWPWGVEEGCVVGWEDGERYIEEVYFLLLVRIRGLEADRV